MGVLIALACRNELAWRWLVARRKYLYPALWSVVIVMLLAAVSWQLVERPLIRRAHTNYLYAS